MIGWGGTFGAPRQATDELRAHQEADLRALLHQAHQHVPAYRRRLDEAEACLADEDNAPSRCGVIQSAACELEMAVGRLIAMCARARPCEPVAEAC